MLQTVCVLAVYVRGSRPPLATAFLEIVYAVNDFTRVTTKVIRDDVEQILRHALPAPSSSSPHQGVLR